MKFSGLLIFVLMMLKAAVFGQSKEKVNSLYAFMQANADTTIVMEYVSNWMGSPEAYFLSKKDGILNCYTYRDAAYLSNGNHPIPADIRSAMKKVSGTKILFEPMDVNEFFKVSLVDKKTLSRMWYQVNRLKPWTMMEDKIKGAGCDIDSTSHVAIYDGGGINLYLITKAEIRKLYFDAPEFYVKHCKGRRSRKSVLKIESLFRKYVQ
jgi:hypothetical protein